MERPFESDDLHPLWLALIVPVLPNHLHRQLASLRARVGEEHSICKGQVDQRISQRFLLGNGVEVRQMPDLARLFR